MIDNTKYKYNISFKKDLIPSIKTYLIAIGSLIPGYYIGSKILILWYIYIIILSFSNRLSSLLKLSILWAFICGGAYQYHLVGDSNKDIAFRGINFLLYITMFILYLINPKSKNRTLYNNFYKYMILLLAVVLISGIVNYINPTNIFQYLWSNFNWLFWAIIITTVKFKESEYKSFISLIIGILIVNSIFGFLQQFFLPAQTTPDGYTPVITDVASGMLGVTEGPHLTSLCIGMGGYFIYKLLILKDKKSIIFIIIYFLQPFTSESKGTLLIGLLTTALSLLLIIYYLKIYKLKLFTILNSVIILIFIYAGLKIFDVSKHSFSRDYSYTYYVNEFFKSKKSLSDFAKIQGYLDSILNIAPKGKLGIIFGIGPSNFSAQIRSKYLSWLYYLGYDISERNEVSSADFKVTEMTQLISEIGFMGFILFLFSIYKLYIKIIKNAKIAVDIDEKIYLVFLSQFLIILIINSFYWAGLLSKLYYSYSFWVFASYYFKDNG